MLSMMATYKRMRDEAENLRDLDTTIGYLALGGGLSKAHRLAEARRAPQKVQDILKAAQAGGTADNIGVSISSGFGTFFSQMRNLGVADAMQPFALAMPRHRARFMLISAVAAGTVAEGAGKPVRRLQYTSNEATPSKGTAMVVLTRELAMEPEIQRTVRQELQRSLAQWTDEVLLTACAANSDASPTVAGSFQDFTDDLHELMNIVRGSAQSNYFLVVTPTIAKAVAAMGLNAGLNLDWRGFELAGVRVMPSDGQVANKMTLIDASQVAMRLGDVELRASDEGDVQMDTAPTGTSATSVAQSTLVSLFQSNSVAVLCERAATIEAITDYACASFTDVVVGEAGGSPAG